MLSSTDRRLLISKMLKSIDMISKLSNRNFRLDQPEEYKLNITNRVDLLELKKIIEDSLDKCKEDGY